MITQGVYNPLIHLQQSMINTTQFPNGPNLSFFDRCLNIFSPQPGQEPIPAPIHRLCTCAPSQELSMCHQAQKWLFHIPDSEPNKIVSDYTRPIPSYSLSDKDNVAMVIHQHCKYRFSALRKSRRQQEALERVLRRVAGELKVKRLQPYCEVYGWLGAQLMHHGGEAITHYILRHLILSMRLYDSRQFQRSQALVITKMTKHIPQALQILEAYHIDVMDIIRNHSNSLFAESIPQNMMGWLITEYLKNKWVSFIDIMSSFIDNRLDKNTAESRQELWKMFLTGAEVEWPWVFCNMNMEIKEGE